MRLPRKHGENVLDPFGGSGSTLMSCEHTGRRAFLMELDPSYSDVIVKRWEKKSGKTAVLEETGQTFAEVAAPETEPQPAPPKTPPAPPDPFATPGA
jgi:DNA modification methylase